MWKFDTVTILSNFIKSRIQNDNMLSDLCVVGELSRFKVYSSGHAYFSIKDEQNVISCVMFKSNLSKLDFQPVEGMKVELMGKLDFYGPSGQIQVNCREMKLVGAGDLMEKYKQLYAKLEKEGLFSASHKKPIPMLPKRIGVITSPSGAVIHDIVNTLRRRNPHFDLVLYPASVQGANCPPEVIEGIKYFAAHQNVDVLIIARGGGSYEDLYGFNDEGIARAVYALNIPVVSAIGHDNDYTILDYVADLRAPTPTGAAELVMPKYSDLKEDVDSHRAALEVGINAYLDAKRKELDAIKNHKALHSPASYALQQLEVVKNIKNTLNYKIKTNVNQMHADLQTIKSNLEMLNPDNVLQRGYSYVTDGSGNAIETVESLTAGSKIDIVFSDGKANATINDINKKQGGTDNG